MPVKEKAALIVHHPIERDALASECEIEGIKVILEDEIPENLLVYVLAHSIDYLILHNVQFSNLNELLKVNCVRKGGIVVIPSSETDSQTMREMNSVLDQVGVHVTIRYPSNETILRLLLNSVENH